MQKLLLLEDDENFVSIFGRYFTAGGYEVLKARSVEEVLALWVKGAPDLAVASVRIMKDAGPRVSGALVRQARRLDVPIVASGTWADRTLLTDARADWADEAFSRPTHPERIWDIIRNFLGHVDAPQVQIDLQRFAVPKAARPRPIDWSEEVLDDIVYLIYEISGNLLKKKERLSNMIEKRMRDVGLTRLFDYSRVLRRDRKELANLIDLVTVNETFFFRNREQFDALRDSILPSLAEGKRPQDISIWSAACSIGAEPYSIAMLCSEALPGCRVEIIASDIDRKAIDTASEGAYLGHVVERTPPEYMSVFRRHAHRNGDGRWHVEEDIRKAVSFRHENILDSRHRDLDLALCRNVMIYFDQASIERMVGVLTRSLREGGVLIVGDSEYLACETDELERERHGRTTVYRKRVVGSRD
ncbi:MAG: CheR family methyltransferase [Planctomycetota bacterium]|jgi:chemotaxis protein methyltransferase CheR